MLKRLCAAILAVGLAAGAVAAADEAVTIKIKKAGKGDVVKETKGEEVENLINATVAGMASKEEEKAGSKLTYTDEILARGDKDPKPTKLKRTYESAEQTVRGEKVDLGLKGKAVLIEKGKDEYTFTVEGGKLSKEAAELLGKEFNKKDEPDLEELLVPKKAVKVGDTWEVDVTAVAGMFGDQMSVDKEKAKATGKLVKVYDKDKVKYGVIEFTSELPIQSVTLMKQPVKASDGSKIKVVITVDVCIDGSVYGGTSSGTMEGEIGLKVPQAEINIKLSGKMTSKSETVKK